jgi:regulation of enolase protein 1 (concanavalin A-like superfamily)
MLVGWAALRPLFVERNAVAFLRMDRLKATWISPRYQSSLQSMGCFANRLCPGEKKMNLNQMEVRNEESGRVAIEGGTLTLAANAETDWFHHPADEFRKSDVISVVAEVHETVFSIAARLSVDFNSAYDAGAIFLQVDEENWAKLAFEYSAALKPTIVSVVTRTNSDDSDGPIHAADHVWLRAYCDGKTIAYHFSEDGKYWRFVRWFAIPGLGQRPIKVGFGAQAPTGSGCAARFSNIHFDTKKIDNLRDGT